ncbi:unnamed protein product [Protopolystoma xenopodis]|uniref:Uncharacterized protein n=1 Tax=Protopolystoma xenopodis TaxID=117903 RepID=A0A448XPB4_9PLAT|nr:unnamed protein product [Protopolystoma xenopodis]
MVPGSDDVHHKMDEISARSHHVRKTVSRSLPRTKATFLQHPVGPIYESLRPSSNEVKIRAMCSASSDLSVSIFIQMFLDLCFNFSPYYVNIFLSAAGPYVSLYYFAWVAITEEDPSQFIQLLVPQFCIRQA